MATQADANPETARALMHWALVGLGVLAAVALVIYGLSASNRSTSFWLFAVIFFPFIALDIGLHVRAVRSRAGSGR